MSDVNPRPVVLGAIMGALSGAALGLLIAYRRSQGSTGEVSARSVTSVGLTAAALARQIISLFS